MRLRTRLVVALVSVGLVVTAVSFAGFALYRDAVVTNERTELTRTSESVAAQLETVLTEKRSTVELWATNPDLRSDAATRRAALRSFVDATAFSGASIIARNGTMTTIHAQGLTPAEQRELVGDDFSERTYFQRAIAGSTYVSDPVDAESGFRIVTVSAPIYGDRIVGTLNAAFHVEGGEGDFARVIDAAGTSDRHVRVVANGTTLYSDGSAPMADGSRTEANVTMADTGWTVSTTAVDGSFDAHLQSITLIQAGGLALVVVSIAVLGGWLYREVFVNFGRLQRGLAGLVDGKYGTTVALSGATEWDDVEDRFNELSETLARRHTEVAVLNRVLRHNLRNAMTVVIGSADRIADRTDNRTIADDARRIRNRGESLLELADHARTIEASLHDRSDGTGARRVDDLLEEAASMLADAYPEASVSVVAAPDDVYVPGGDLLFVALDELGRNAVRHSERDPTVRFAAESDGDAVVIRIEDDGPGLPPLERQILTEPFVETPTEHGSGLGLWLVKWLIEWTNGQVSVDVDDGTTVTMRIPQVSPPEDVKALDSSVPDPGSDPDLDPPSRRS